MHVISIILAYSYRMASMVNNFRVQEKLCTLHNQPCSYTVLQNCRITVICPKCIPLHKNTSPCSLLLSIPQLYTYISQTVCHHQLELQQQSYLNIPAFLQQKRRQLEHKHYRIFQHLIRKLNQQKQQLLQQYAQVLKKYQKQEEKYQRNVEQRNNIIRYMNQYVGDQDLFRLKVMVSSQYGLGCFGAMIRMLQVLGIDAKNRDVATIVHDMQAKIKELDNNTILNAVQNILKDKEKEKANINIRILHPLNLQNKNHQFYNNQITQRRNQSQQNIQIRTPRTSRQQSFAQLPKLIFN